MKQLIIIGAGGFGRSVYNLAMDSEGYGKDYEIKGFIDDNIHALDNYRGYPPIIGTIKDYQIIKDDVFVNSIGNIKTKKKCIESILNKGGEFINLIHPSSTILSNVKLGVGCIIDRNVSLGADSSIGDYTLIQNGAVIGHDVTLGNWSRIDCYVVLVGGVKVEDEVCIHTSAVINHNVHIHNNVIVGAGSFVIKNVKENSTVFGNPAKRL